MYNTGIVIYGIPIVLPSICMLVFLFAPRKFRRRTARASTDMNLCLSTGGKSERCSQQFRLLSVYLFLWIEDGIDKLLVRDLAVKMSLGHIIVYLELGVLKKLLSDPCPRCGATDSGSWTR